MSAGVASTQRERNVSGAIHTSGPGEAGGGQSQALCWDQHGACQHGAVAWGQQLSLCMGNSWATSGIKELNAIKVQVTAKPWWTCPFQLIQILLSLRVSRRWCIKLHWLLAAHCASQLHKHQHTVFTQPLKALKKVSDLSLSHLKNWNSWIRYCLVSWAALLDKFILVGDVKTGLS